MSPTITGKVGLLELSGADAVQLTQSANGLSAVWDRYATLDDWRSQVARLNGSLASQGERCVIVAGPVTRVLGEGVLAKIRDTHPNASVVIASERVTVPEAVDALKQGADNVLVVPCSSDHLQSVIDSAMAEASRRNAKQHSAEELKRRLGTLTKAENDVLDSLLNGMPNKQIAQQFGIGLRTVELRRSKIMKKMEAGNLAQLVRFVFEARAEE